MKHATTITNTKDNNRDELPRRIKELIRQKNKTKRKAQRTLNPNYKLETNRLTNIIKEEINTYREEKWDDKVKSLNTADGSLWRMSKALKHKPTIITPISGPQGVAYSSQDKAEVFATSLEEQFKIHTFENDESDKELEQEIHTTIRNFENSPPLIPNFAATAK